MHSSSTQVLGMLKVASTETVLPVENVINFAQITETTAIVCSRGVTVYKATYQNATIAIKELTNMASPLVATAFENEKKILDTLRSHNSVNIIRSYVTTPALKRCAVMEYAPNKSLSSIIDGNQLLSRRIMYKIMSGLLNGINFLHQSGIAHLDIKPDNVVCDAEMNPKIIDFGFAYQFYNSASYPFPGVTGTAEYIAPEMIKYNSISRKADIYSYGVTILELVTKRNPYSGMGNSAVFYSRAANNFKLDFDGCPPEIIPFIQHCTHQDPKARPTAEEALIELDALASPEKYKQNICQKITGYVSGIFAKHAPFLQAQQDQNNKAIMGNRGRL
jgi:serine/threonine protein kinase